MTTIKVKNAILPERGPVGRWDVELTSNTITSITPATSEGSSEEWEPSPLLLPPLCHPHVHLDKAYLLTCNNQHRHQHHNHHHPPHRHQGVRSSSQADDDPPTVDYSNLAPQDGSFAEALKFTSLAKQRYTSPDLYLRGSQLLATSLLQGVTSCRAFVEVDHVTRESCVEVGLKLRESFAGKIKVQLCAFAQDPIFSTEHGEENRRLLTRVLETRHGGIEALGTTPYVEQSRDAALRNIAWAVDTALAHSLHLDFHLDYNLDASQSPMAWDVVRLLKEKRWTERAPMKTIVLGHCTRLTLCDDAEMAELAREIREARLPVHFVGLPTSDLFMMGRPSADGSASASRPRGTLQVLDMIHNLKLDACLSVNNVGNAFTPWGTGDPLTLASLGVGLYQASTDEHARTLFECVSTRARRAIGIGTSVNTAVDRHDQDHPNQEDALDVTPGRTGELLVVKNEEWVGCPGHLGLKVPARQRVSVRDVVWDPPQNDLRQILRCNPTSHADK